MTGWTPYDIEDKATHPPAVGLYWWRLNKPVTIGGLVIDGPAWVDPARQKEPNSEIVPAFAHWTGWRNTVQPNTEWKCIAGGDTEHQFDFGPDVQFYPCPFCNCIPALKWEERPEGGGFYGTTRIWRATDFTVKCFGCHKASVWSKTLATLMASWNQRAYDTSNLKKYLPDTKRSRAYW